MPAHELHLTLLHIGKLDEMYAELRAAGADLSFAAFEAEADTFIRTVMPLLPAQTAVRAERCSHFGPKRTALVLRVRVDDVLRAAHAASLVQLQKFLGACLPSKSSDFMRGNHNLRYALEFKPHITLLRSVAGDLSDYDASHLPQLHMRLLPLDHNLKLGDKSA